MKMGRLVLWAWISGIAAACGGQDAMVSLDPDHNYGVDTERSGDPVEQEEAALRANPVYDADFTAAGEEFGVPPSLLKAVAWTNTRYEMVIGEQEFEGRAPVAGVMGLGGTFLERGAALAGVSVEEAKTNARANIRAMAALLAEEAKALGVELGVTTDATRLAAWGPVVEKISGVEGSVDARRSFVRDDVFGAMRLGLGELTEEISQSGQALELSDEYGTMSQELVAGPDYPASIWRESPNADSRAGHTPRFVVIHTCESGYSGCWSWLSNPSAVASAHYVVREDGKEITQLVRESYRAWHVGATYYSSNNGGAEAGLDGIPTNYISVGIEHGGYARQATWAEGLLDASAKLTCSITKRQKIPRDRQHIVGHGQLQPYDRYDPGANWPWANYIERVRKHCDGGVTPPPTKPGTPSTGEIIVDSNNNKNNTARGYAKASASWLGTAGTPGFYGTGYFYASTASMSDPVEFWFYLPAAATKTVDAWWTAGGNRSTVTPFVAFDANGKKLGTVKVDQSTGGKRWNTVGKFNFSAGWNRVMVSRWAPKGKVVIADAVRIR